MKPASLSAVALRLRLAAMALGPVFCAAALLMAAAGAALAWLAPQRALQAERQKIAMRLVGLPAAQHAGPPASADQNLALFYATLGEKRYAEQQVRTLFGLAAKAGLSLSQGEYKGAYDRNGRLHTYQVTLPVKGSYRDVWQFGLMALRAIPFASLDEIGFKRDSIGDAQVEARLRLTLYMADKPGAPQ